MQDANDVHRSGLYFVVCVAEKLKEKPSQQAFGNSMEIELVVPELPQSKEEAAKRWAEGYVQNREHLGKVFRFAGQMFVAPIGTFWTVP